MPVGSGGVPGARRDPYVAHNFLVEIDGLVCGGFTHIDGLESTIEVEDRHEGGVNASVRRLVKGASSPNVILRQGLTDLDVFWTWFDLTRQGVILRRSVTVMLLDRTRLPVVWWDLVAALPVKWTGPTLDSADGAVAVETIELSHLGITKPPASTLTSGIRAALGGLPDAASRWRR
jgi:phage tail-like protein